MSFTKYFAADAITRQLMVLSGSLAVVSAPAFSCSNDPESGDSPLPCYALPTLEPSSPLVSSDLVTESQAQLGASTRPAIPLGHSVSDEAQRSRSWILE